MDGEEPATRWRATTGAPKLRPRLFPGNTLAVARLAVPAGSSASDEVVEGTGTVGRVVVEGNSRGGSVEEASCSRRGEANLNAESSEDEGQGEDGLGEG